MAMRSPAAELRKANSRRAYLHPFKSLSTSRVPRHIQPSPDRTPDKPRKEGFFSQLRRSFTSAHRSSSSSSSSATPAAIAGPAVPSKEGVAPPWGRRVKNGLSKPLKIVKTSYVDCMMGIAENPQVESFGCQQSNSCEAYAFQASASRHLQRSSSSTSEHELVSPIDAQLHALLRHSKHHAHVISSK